MLLAAVTGASTGLFVRFFEYVVAEIMLDEVLHGPLWFVAIAPGIGLVLSAILLHTLGAGASPATSDEYLRAFHDPEYPLRPRAFVGRIAAAVTTLGFGGAMGLEGPSMYGGSALGAFIQRRLPRPFRGADYRTLLVAGAAAGCRRSSRRPRPARSSPSRSRSATRWRAGCCCRRSSPARPGYLTFVALSSTEPIFSFVDDDRIGSFGIRDLVGAILIGVFCAVGARRSPG